ncbi:MAG: GlsB/YeaQ/YmgE family stress response membrane protein [Actinobacteria bacterium]|nr:GlsB/YeaQ/YmgE family stress response membrane protein [Actinomycetota bacterium]
MDILVFVLLVALSGLIVGALARLAVPGPDPMSVWRTIALGIVGSLLGGLIAGVFGIGGSGGIFLLSLVGAVVLLILYRRVFQGRGITGPGAKRR